MRDPWSLAYPDHWERRRAVAVYIVRKYREGRRLRGTQAAARQLRKQGVPLELALLILGVRPTRGLPILAARTQESPAKTSVTAANPIGCMPAVSAAAPTGYANCAA